MLLKLGLSMQVIIVGGFLGSGKTSVVLQMARYLVGDTVDKEAKVVIVENEIGEVGIDDRVLKSEGYSVKGLFSGCVCCTMSGELVININTIQKDMDPDYLIMEATGVAYPSSIKEILEQALKLNSKICCITDAKRWARLLKPMGTMIQGQLEDADVILINKIDLVEADVLSEVVKSVKSFNDTAICHSVSAMQKIDDSIWSELIAG